MSDLSERLNNLSERQRLILTKLLEPKTIDEVSIELTVSYWTVQKTIRSLQLLDFVHELPFPLNNRKVFQATYHSIDPVAGSLNFSFKLPGDRVITELASAFAAKMAEDDSNINKIGKDIARIIAHLYMRAYHQEGAIPVPAPDPLHAKEALATIHTYLTGLTEFIAVLLLSPVWVDEPVVLKLLGNFDLDLARGLAVEFENTWVQEHG